MILTTGPIGKSCATVLRIVFSHLFVIQDFLVQCLILNADLELIFSLAWPSPILGWKPVVAKEGWLISQHLCLCFSSVPSTWSPFSSITVSSGACLGCYLCLETFGHPPIPMLTLLLLLTLTLLGHWVDYQVSI